MKANHNEIVYEDLRTMAVPNISKSKNESKSQHNAITHQLTVRCA